MIVLVSALLVLRVNSRQANVGRVTCKPGTLTTDFFVNLLDMDTEWKATSDAADAFAGTSRSTGKSKGTATRVDLVFGSNSELRALAEVYAADDAKDKFVKDFVAAWQKVISVDRFDIKQAKESAIAAVA